MPGSNAQPPLANPLKALLASACLLVCGPASHGPAFDADLAATLGAGEQSLSGQTEIAAAPDDPFVSREIALSGFVGKSFEASLVRSGASADLSLKLRDALSSALHAGNQFHSGDKFHVRYEQTFAGDGREVDSARIVSAEIMTANNGRIAFYRFRPARGRRSYGSPAASRWRRRPCGFRCKRSASRPASAFEPIRSSSRGTASAHPAASAASAPPSTRQRRAALPWD